MLRTEALRNGNLAEETACILFNGRIQRSVGYDLIVKDKLVEVRSRHDFENGDPYRLTLTPKKMQISNFVIAVHYNVLHDISCALLIRTKSLIPLYLEYLQASEKQAHLNWKKVLALVNGKDAINITSGMISADAVLMTRGLYTL